MIEYAEVNRGTVEETSVRCDLLGTSGATIVLKEIKQ